MKLSIPNMTAQAHSEKLSHLIQQEITESGGFITFARFMELALYTPELGYYSAEKPLFGKGGDFITAPEISPLFAQCVAQQCKQILNNLGKGDILEIGAGTGIFAKDLLLELEHVGSLPEQYFILEISAGLCARQKKLLSEHCPHLLSRIHWLNELPAAVNGIVIANEVLDAMPVHCFSISNGEIKERCVTWDKDHFTWLLRPPTPAILENMGWILEKEIFPEKYFSEINLMIPGWINAIASSLNKGIILLFDYGYGRAEYYQAERGMGTLMCYYQHHRHDDPLQLVGLQDITAHVDFTLVVESACAAGCALAGYTAQALFLMHCGLLELAKKEEGSTIASFHQAQAIKKLTLPSQMGELIKVMALSKNYSQLLCGFPLPDRRRDLG